MFQAVPLDFTDSVDVILIPTLLHRTAYSFMKEKSAIKYMIKIKSYPINHFHGVVNFTEKHVHTNIKKIYTGLQYSYV